MTRVRVRARLRGKTSGADSKAFLGQKSHRFSLLASPMRLADHRPHSHARRMFVVSDADAAAIRAIFHQRGELSAAVELRRLFPGLNAETARDCARTIAGWEPRPGLCPVRLRPDSVPAKALP
jgi:hypothetical protein